MLKRGFRIFFLLLWISPCLYAEEVEIAGKVVDKTTKAGIGGALVVVLPSGARTITKPNGNFSIQVEKTDGMAVQIMKQGYISQTIKGMNLEIYAELDLSTKVEGQKVLVEGKRDEKRVVVSRQQVDRENIQRATSNVFGDSVKVVQTLPGVVTTNEFSALMYVRGGSAYEVMNYYDRILLWNAYVWGGMMSVFNPDVVQSIDFYSGAFPAEYGNAMSGVMDVKMRDGKTNAYGGLFDLSIATFTGLIEGPIGEPGNTENSFLVAVRRTHYDLAVKMLAETGAIDSKYSGVQLPFFYDAHIRFKFKLDDYNVLRIFSLVVYEGMDFSFDDISSSSESTKGWESGNEFHYMDFRYMQGVSLTTAFSKEVVMENTFGYDYSTGDFKYVDKQNPVNIKYNGHYITYRNDTTIKPGRHHTIKVGAALYAYMYDMSGRIIISSLPDGADLSSLPNDGHGNYYITDADYLTLVNTYKKDYNLNYEQKTYLLPTVYIQDDIEVVDDFMYLNLGFRGDYFNISKRYTYDPRAGLKFVFKDLFNLKIAGGIYSQQIVDGVHYDSQLGNPNLKPAKSYHGVLSFEKDIPDYFFRLDFFYKYYKDLVNQDPVLNYVNGTVGRSYGFDLFLQKKIDKHWDGWISYTYVLTERKVNQRSPGVSNNPDFGNNSMGTIPLGQWYSPEFDRRHTLNIVFNYTFAPKWELATTTKFATGVPYTPITGRNAVRPTSDGTAGGTVTYDPEYLPVWGDYNSGRMPFYMNMDVKLSMPFFWKHWSSYVQLMNIFGLFGSKKVEQYYYSADYTQRREATGLPFMLIAGIRAEF